MLEAFISFVALGAILCHIAVAESTLQDNSQPRHRRSVGGSITPNKAYPFVVSISVPRVVHLCGGTIITPSVILTAGHCIYRYSNLQFSVLVRSNDLKTGGSIYKVSQKLLHEKYRKVRTSYNDIGLLKLEEPIKNIDESNEIVTLARKDEVVPVHSNATVIGWGALYNDMDQWKLDRDPNETVEQRATSMKELLGGYTRKLRSVNIRVVPIENCKADLSIWYKNIKLSTEICTQASKKGTCRGDSGTPLVLNERQIGIVSGSKNCGGKPTIYTNVAAYRWWIDQKVELLTHSKERTRS
ncbi:hypothetical protein QAD02_022207 [Eretmocerus hayati]|uniref:Uncharacterized protein n=1 Tax=Eretmocerus hayati TaxID=131215 RepID=A0ACC2PTW6_9HYME|nr:hypothetical protein QAD02_022207 [Eretmocerus hayati]